jgi:hypothetical protein
MKIVGAIPFAVLAFGAEGKTEGWVAGNVHLDANVAFRIGASARLN